MHNALFYIHILDILPKPHPVNKHFPFFTFRSIIFFKNKITVPSRCLGFSLISHMAELLQTKNAKRSHSLCTE